MEDIASTATETPESPSGLESLARLEERILETVEQLRAARGEKAAAEHENARLRDELARAEQEAGGLRGEIESFRQERRQILQRVEHLLTQIDALG
jgi:chromosome segregation ATPase